MTVRLYKALVVALLVAAGTTAFSDSATATRQLAGELADEADYRAAAIEFRRLALETEDPNSRAAYYWAAAYQYMQAGQVNLVDKMLDFAEDASLQIGAHATLLRAEVAYQSGLMDTADFYLESMLNSGATNQPAAYVQRRRASLQAGRHDLEQAMSTLGDDPDLGAARAALLEYGKRNDKRPWLGGLLGVIPGLGYAYSGEYANAVRSLILNGIFIYGMVDAADNENWGMFTAISFFELTWYTGSIYGGIDSVHRYNHDRLEACRDAIDGSTAFTPDLGRLPFISLEFDF